MTQKFMLIYKFVIILSTLLLILASFAYLKNRKSVTNKIFALFSVVTSVWLMLNIVPLISPASLDDKLFFIRIIMGFAAIQVACFYLLAENFPHRHFVTSNTNFITLIVATTVLVGLALSPWLFTSLTSTSNGLPQPIPGPAMFIFLPATLLILLAGFVRLIKKYLSSTGDVKSQVKLILVGAGLMLGTVITLNFLSVVILGTPRFIPFGIFGVCFFIFFAAIAVFRYQLLDIRVIAQESFIASVNIIFLTQVFFSENTTNTLIAFVTLLIIVIISFFALRNIRKESMLKQKLLEVSKNLESTNEELKASIEKRSDLYANISHEFKTPITVLRGNVQVAVPNSDEKKIIDNELERMNRLTSELLELSRADAGKIQLNISQVDVKSLFEQICEEVFSEAQKNGITLDRGIPAKLHIYGDREKLYTLFLNLVTNAIKYNKRGGHVVIRSSELNDRIIVTVSDDGFGIAKEHLNKIFERFYRVDKQLSRKIGGTGLGLAIVKLMTELHGGEINVESEEGKGTKFTVCLPKTKP